MAPKYLIGRKVGMTQVFTETGEFLPVTIVEAGPCPVVQVKLQKTDGYSALQLGFSPQKPQRLHRPRSPRHSSYPSGSHADSCWQC